MVKVKTIKNVKKIKINGYYYKNASSQTNWKSVWVKESGEMIFTFKEHIDYKYNDDRYVWEAKIINSERVKRYTYSLGQIKPLFKEVLKNNDLTII